MGVGGVFKKIGKGFLKGAKVTGEVLVTEVAPIAADTFLPPKIDDLVSNSLKRAWRAAVKEATDDDSGVVDEAQLKEILMAQVMKEIEKRKS